MRLLHARDDENGGGLSKNTIIIISVVCGSVAILVFALFLWRLFSRCLKGRESTPLPPVQDLAHRREQQLAAFNERYNTNRRSHWLDVSDSEMPARASFKTGSSVSLLPTQDKNGGGFIDDATTVESSIASPTHLESEVNLSPPNPMFYPPLSANSSPHVSMISTDSSYSTLPRAPTVSPSSSAPASEAHSYSQMSVESGSASLRQPRPRSRTPSRNGTRPSPRGRPLSQISGHTIHTTRSTSTMRGAPHQPYNNVQIVLPAPLASQLPPAQQRSSPYTPGLSSRNSLFVDQWVMVDSRPSTTNKQRRKSSSTGPSRSKSASSRPAPDRSSSTPPTRNRHTLSASMGDSRRAAEVASSPHAGVNRSVASQHTRSSSSLRNEVHRAPPLPAVPMRTYSSLADLAESSFEVNEFMRERGRAHVGPRSPQVTLSPSLQSSASTQQAISSPAPPLARPRSQSRGKLQKAHDPVR